MQRYRILNIFQRLLVRFSLRITTLQFRAKHKKTVFILFYHYRKIVLFYIDVTIPYAGFKSKWGSVRLCGRYLSASKTNLKRTGDALIGAEDF